MAASIGGIRYKGDVDGGVPTLATALEFLESLLVALEANHQHHAENMHGEDQVDEETHELIITFSQLRSKLKRLPHRSFAFIVAGLGDVLYQLRAWYVHSLGLLLLDILDKYMKDGMPRGNLAPTPLEAVGTCHAILQGDRHPWSTVFPELAVLRVLEGVVLICTALHLPKEVADRVQELVRRRLLPLGTAIRLEATFGALQLKGGVNVPNIPPAKHVDAKEDGEADLVQKVQELIPTADVVARLEGAQDALKAAVPVVLPGWHPDFFGSCVNGFNVRSSDIDCVLLPDDEDMRLAFESGQLSTLAQDAGEPSSSPSASPQRQTRPSLKALCGEMAKKLGAQLKSNPDLGFEVQEVIHEARVPIVKCKWVEGDVAVDISFNNTLPLYNSRLLRAYADLDHRVADLGRLVKHWAKERGVNDASQGTLSSYSFTILVIHYLQHINFVPNLQDKSLVKPAEALPKYGEVLLVDGRYDVWFLDPAKVGPEDEALQGWREKWTGRPATLSGLLSGFFRYWAYEFPFYMNVLNIHRQYRVSSKMGFFKDLANLQQVQEDAGGDEETALELGEGALAEEEASLPHDKAAEDDIDAEHLPPLPEDETAVHQPEDEALSESDGEEEVKLTKGVIGAVSDEQEETESTAAPSSVDASKPMLHLDEHLARTSSRQEDAAPASESASPQRKLNERWRLPKPVHASQGRLASKQLLCIEDPMEQGRLLGTSFNGMERIAHEWRQACYLLSSEYKGAASRYTKLFAKAGMKHVRDLKGDQLYPNLLGRGQRTWSSASSSSSSNGTAHLSKGASRGSANKIPANGVASGGARPVGNAPQDLEKAFTIPVWAVDKIQREGGLVEQFQRRRGVHSVILDVSPGSRGEGGKLQLAFSDTTTAKEVENQYMRFLNDHRPPHQGRQEAPPNRHSEDDFPVLGGKGGGGNSKDSYSRGAGWESYDRGGRSKGWDREFEDWEKGGGSKGWERDDRPPRRRWDTKGGYDAYESGGKSKGWEREDRIWRDGKGGSYENSGKSKGWEREERIWRDGKGGYDAHENGGKGKGWDGYDRERSKDGKGGQKGWNSSAASGKSYYSGTSSGTSRRPMGVWQ